jgi:hypothetical protein
MNIQMHHYLLLDILQLLLQLLDIGARGGVSRSVVHQRPGESVVDIVDVVVDVAIAVVDAVGVAVVADAGSAVVDRGHFARRCNKNN